MRIYKEESKKKIEAQKIIEITPEDQTNTQENRQDMDQNQQVDVKPTQFVSIVVNNQMENYTGKITGYLHIEKDDPPYCSIKVTLYFANHRKYPVYHMILDKNFNFAFEDLPPGFYMIEVFHEDHLLKRVPNIKVMPSQTIQQSILID